MKRSAWARSGMSSDGKFAAWLDRKFAVSERNSTLVTEVRRHVRLSQQSIFRSGGGGIAGIDRRKGPSGRGALTHLLFRKAQLDSVPVPCKKYAINVRHLSPRVHTYAKVVQSHLLCSPAPPLPRVVAGSRRAASASLICMLL